MAITDHAAERAPVRWAALEEDTMRRMLLVVIAIAAALVPMQASAASAATTVQHSIPFDTVVSACTEDIHLTGSLLFVGTETVSASGAFVFTFHFQPQHVVGVGLTSGATYHSTGLTRETTVLEPTGGFTDTYINRFHVVGTGGTPTYYVSETSHITVTASGDVRVAVDHFSASC
jgi:hypothetical protein